MTLLGQSREALSLVSAVEDRLDSYIDLNNDALLKLFGFGEKNAEVIKSDNLGNEYKEKIKSILKDDVVESNSDLPKNYRVTTTSKEQKIYLKWLSCTTEKITIQINFREGSSKELPSPVR